MLDKSRLLEKTLSQTKAGGCKEGRGKMGRKGRQKTSGEERQVRLEIVELLQARMGKRPCGRPRIHHGTALYDAWLRTVHSTVRYAARTC